jgi:RHS repeat-associated protein
MLFLGSANGINTTPDWEAFGVDYDKFGNSVASAGDVDGDGYEDVIIGASRQEAPTDLAGSAYLYLGSAAGLSAAPDWVTTSDQPGAWYGYTVSSAGDVNGDGYDDVFVGASNYDNGETDEGRVYLYYGSSSGLSDTDNWTVEANQDYAFTGASTNSAAIGVGDVNGDGYDDAIVGIQDYSNGENKEGMIHLYYGSANGLASAPDWTAESNSLWAAFGWSVEGVGDINKDGYADFIVGADEHDWHGRDRAGRVFLYYGGAAAPTLGWTMAGSQVNGRFGHDVGAAGDVNGDGLQDLIVGEWRYSNGESLEGRALVYETSLQMLETQTTVIVYEYDDLYRLTGADYTGHISATYRYQYDPVGNMKAYTETHSTGSGQAANTTRVTRYFDDANRLMTATDFDLGSSSYTYDNNGNLTLIVPPGEEDRQHYAFNQRNLMINHALSTNGTNLQTQATFGYDGAGNRLQQVDYTGGTPTTTTYANDIQGLTQVLLADDGTSQTANLFGFDLIHQQNSKQNDSLYLLTDGLGSVRQEISADAVVATTTYDPYGNVLNQSGESNTTYGYTGEQLDSATGLQYLRARYYNPAQHSFMGKDPWGGDMRNPQSINGWSYVDNNPTSLVDLTGQSPLIPDLKSQARDCRKTKEHKDYAICMRSVYDVDEPDDPSVDLGIGFEFKVDSEGCHYGAIPYRAPGYIEGISVAGSVIFGGIGGIEVVFDYATMERQMFNYAGISFQDTIGDAYSQYWGRAYGFRNWQNITDDYKGLFSVGTLGIGFGIPLVAETGPGVSVGRTTFKGGGIKGHTWYLAGSISVDPVPILDVGRSFIWYWGRDDAWAYIEQYEDGKKLAQWSIIDTIWKGNFSPWLLFRGYNGETELLEPGNTPAQIFIRYAKARPEAERYYYIFNQIHYASYD